MRIPVRLGIVLAVIGVAGTAAQAQEPAAPTPAEQAEDANKLAQMLANPVANLWSLTFQVNNYD